MGQPGSGSSSKSASMLSLQFSADELGARLAQLAYARYMQFEQEIGVPIDFHRTGWLSVATDAAAPALLAGSAMLRGLGVASEVLDPAEIAYRCPLLHTDDLAVGVFGPDDGPFDPHMILWGYLRRARELGARLLTGVRATGLEVQSGPGNGRPHRPGLHRGGHGDQRSRAVGGRGGRLGRRRPAAAQPGAHDPGDRRTAGCPARPPLRGGRGHRVVLSARRGWVLMGMGQEPVPMGSLEHPATDPALVDAMIDVAIHRVPTLGSASILTTWTGVRPLTPDSRPILGAVPGVDGLLLNCGWGGVGIILAPVAGQLLAEVVSQGRASTFDIAPFSIERFANEQRRWGPGMRTGRRSHQ